MASREEHCQDCVRELGETFVHVHEWLDALFAKLGPKHRSARHHQGGVEAVRQRWGDRAAQAAIIHIKKDCNGKVPNEKEAQAFSFFGDTLRTPSLGRTILTDEPDTGVEASGSC
jgi:hypothetical protein